MMNILRQADSVLIQKENINIKNATRTSNVWKLDDVKLELSFCENNLKLYLTAPESPVMRIGLRWDMKLPADIKILGDAWERAYGDLEWRGIVPERIMPWYVMISSKNKTTGLGVKTAPAALCFWQIDSNGIWLWLDVRNGGVGVKLADRKLEAATVVQIKNIENENAFDTTSRFCKMMCDKPRLPDHPVYGGNNWYYAYGKSSSQKIIEDSKLIASWADGIDNKPYMLIDACWQKSIEETGSPIAGAPWNKTNSDFPDMPALVTEMKNIGVRPGIWLRPLAAASNTPANLLLPESRAESCTDIFTRLQTYDPSIPEVLDQIEKDFNGLIDWGFDLIKHDFTTIDIFGRFGTAGAELTNENWHFHDQSKTTAEIITNLYKTIRKGTGKAVIIGCNTLSHLAAGIFEIQRTGEDTSGIVWEQTRLFGINNLAFRMPQHNAFYAIDGDCVGLTKNIDWDLNKQWLELLAKSGTPLFVSASRDALGKEQEKAIKNAFKIASEYQSIGVPIDWMNTTCPSIWNLSGEEVSFDWTNRNKASFMEKFFGTENI